MWRGAGAGAANRGRADRPELGFDVRDDAIDLGGELRDIAGVVNRPRRERELVGERRLGGDASARFGER